MNNERDNIKSLKAYGEEVVLQHRGNNSAEKHCEKKVSDLGFKGKPEDNRTGDKARQKNTDKRLYRKKNQEKRVAERKKQRRRRKQR